MVYPTIEVVDRFRALLEGNGGMLASLAALSSSYGREGMELADLKVEFVRVPAEIHEKSVSPKHPVVHVYCDQMENGRTEKFSKFSGRMRLVTEIRVSQDRLEGMTEMLHFYLDALRDVVEKNVGSAGEGMYLDGGYDVTIEAVRKGGLNYQQAGKLACWAILNRS